MICIYCENHKLIHKYTYNDKIADTSSIIEGGTYIYR
jgi:hypothetical protein